MTSELATSSAAGAVAAAGAVGFFVASIYLSLSSAVAFAGLLRAKRKVS